MRPSPVNDSSAVGLGRFVPPIVTLLLAVIMLLPLGTNLSVSFMPNLVMISVFYWISRRPVLMPYGACALTGLFLDLWMGVPLGLNMLSLLLVRFFVLNQLKYYRGRSRLVHWAVFSGLSTGLYALSWVISYVLEGQTTPLFSVGVAWLVTSFAYAPVGLVLGRIRRFALGG